MERDSPVPRRGLALADFALRSLLPLAVVVLLLATLLIGPFGLLLAAFAWWQVVRRIR